MSRFIAIVIVSLSVAIIVGPNAGSAAASAKNDDDFPRKQSAIFQLLWQSSGGSPAKSHPEIFERVKNYKLDDVVEACHNKTLARELEAYTKSHKADKSRVVSYYRDEEIEAIRSLANVLIDARSFDDFVTIAAWSVDQWDELGWIHALAIALQRREDSRGLRMPNLWEIMPNYFFGADVVLQSYMIKTGEMSRPDNTIVIEDAGDDAESEQSVLAYYLEDVGLNEFYFNFASSRPHWLGPIDDQEQTFGELYYHVHKMLLAKYRLEMSAVMTRKPDVEYIDWEQPIAIGYKSDMIHHNGRLVPARVAGTNFPLRSYMWLEDAKHYESRLAMALDAGVMNSYISNRLSLGDPRHFNDFCNVLEGNRATLDLRYFGSVERLYRRLLGSHAKHLPASIEMPMTCSRDPAFYRLIKRIVDFAERYKSRLEPYSLAELTYDAVRVDYVHLDDNLHTRFEAYESYVNHHRRDLRSTTDSGSEHRNHHQQQRQAQQSSSSSSPPPPHTVKVRRTRLQSRPFDYEIGVHADSPARAVVVRLFLGPERDEFGREIDPLLERDRFYEIDRWLLDLKAGMNKIVRSSAEAVYYAPESVSSAAYNKLVARTVRGVGDSDRMSKPVRHALPGRLILPRGTADGLRAQLFVCLHPAPEENKIRRYQSALFEGLLLDGRSLGFPLDRRVSDDVLPKFQNVKNCMLKPVRIFNGDKSEDADDAEP